ncbi:hypothetical protein [Shimia sp. MMG029]|uniref:hypothetical protein n=1 Tax=Shimia sp. MMG029 TaxID=3021978 RepID=UPI0022FE19D4|nr:hypothetical protein [Shimia sp. MMG029]MDA5556171.1 hypothetical protein [Shimia sp. MMG029]
MAHASKIATCCYCGTRAALVLRGDTRHELSCANCGAPLHDLKHLRVAPPAQQALAHRPKSKDKRDKPRKSKPVSYAAYGGSPEKAADKKSEKYKKRPAKKKKSTMRWFLKEAFDVIEDIFD